MFLRAEPDEAIVEDRDQETTGAFVLSRAWHTAMDASLMMLVAELALSSFFPREGGIAPSRVDPGWLVAYA